MKKFFLISLLVLEFGGCANHTTTKECDNGVGSSCGYLAWKIYSNDCVEAIKLYEKGCNLGDSYSCERLGFIYRDGEQCKVKHSYILFSKTEDITIKRSTKKAINFFEKGCSLKGKESCYRLGWLYKESKDFNKALLYFKQGCDSAKSQACGEAGEIYEKGKSGEKNLSLALSYYIKACKIGGSFCWKIQELDPNFLQKQKQEIIAKFGAKKECESNADKMTGCSIISTKNHYIPDNTMEIISYANGQAVNARYLNNGVIVRECNILKDEPTSAVLTCVESGKSYTLELNSATGQMKRSWVGGF